MRLQYPGTLTQERLQLEHLLLRQNATVVERGEQPSLGDSLDPGRGVGLNERKPMALAGFDHVFA